MQVQAVQPTSMACPPNIWGGLYDKYRAKLAAASANEPDYAAHRTARRDVVSLFGGRIQNLVTGGAPTPPAHMAFARELCMEVITN